MVSFHPLHVIQYITITLIFQWWDMISFISNYHDSHTFLSLFYNHFSWVWFDIVCISIFYKIFNKVSQINNNASHLNSTAIQGKRNIIHWCKKGTHLFCLISNILDLKADLISCNFKQETLYRIYTNLVTSAKGL